MPRSRLIAPTLAPFLHRVDSDCTRCMEKLCDQDGHRAEAPAELIYIYSGSGLGAAAQLAQKAAAMPPSKTMEPLRKRLYGQALRKLKKFDAEHARLVEQMKPWEAQIDFATLGWDGPKPSEMLTQCAQQVQQFMQENAALENTLDGKANRSR